jgi:Skp family chaperone for outer membrane proteins
MKNLKKHFYLLLVIIMSISCQTKSEKRIEIATNDYIHFVDSVTEYKKEEAQKNWKTIEKDFEKKLNALNLRIDSSEGASEFEGKIDSATDKFEIYRKAVFKGYADPDINHYLD